jgi:hypothetical protein
MQTGWLFYCRRSRARAPRDQSFRGDVNYRDEPSTCTSRYTLDSFVSQATGTGVLGVSLSF